MSADSQFSFVHKPSRFIDVIDEEWVTAQLPAETLFAHVSEFDDEDDGAAAADRPADDDDDDGGGAEHRWDDLNLAAFLASAPAAVPSAADRPATAAAKSGAAQ
jgi:hypothetical protein